MKRVILLAAILALAFAFSYQPLSAQVSINTKQPSMLFGGGTLTFDTTDSPFALSAVDTPKNLKHEKEEHQSGHLQIGDFGCVAYEVAISCEDSTGSFICLETSEDILYSVQVSFEGTKPKTITVTQIEPTYGETAEYVLAEGDITCMRVTQGPPF